jgi:hypothetical protein
MHSRAFRHLQVWSAPVGSMLLLLGATSLSGCAQQAKVTSAWQENSAHNQPFTRVLVVGISPNVKQRCRFERNLAARIDGALTKSVASCDAVTQVDPLTRESIDQAVAWLKADAVVATSLVAVGWEANDGGSRDTRGSATYKATDSGYATGYYGAYGVPVIYGTFQTAPSVTTLGGTAKVTTKVYETRGPTVVYTLDTAAKDLDTADTRLDAVTVPIADRLRRDGLIH